MTRPIELWAESRLRPAPETVLNELRGDLVRIGCVEGRFDLGAGISSRYYFDKYLFETRPTVLRRVARLLSDLVPAHAERLVAQAPGALAVGVAVSLEIGLPLVIVRPDATSSEEVRLEGEIYDGERVVLVEDVVVTGSRALAGVAHVTAAGAVVTDVVAVIDREHGATGRFADRGLHYWHLFTSSDLGVDEEAAEARRGR
jgi:orotate phosphoribosyltransferase